MSWATIIPTCNNIRVQVSNKLEYVSVYVSEVLTSGVRRREGEKFLWAALFLGAANFSGGFFFLSMN